MVFVKVPLILPVPLAAMPVTVTLLSLVQLYTVPATLPVKTMVVIAVPEQVVCAAGVATALGIGLMITLKEQVAVFPAGSVAVNVISVVPTGKTEPDAGPAVCVTTTEQLSVAVGVAKVTTWLPHNTILEGQLASTPEFKIFLNSVPELLPPAGNPSAQSYPTRKV